MPLFAVLLYYGAILCISCEVNGQLYRSPTNDYSFWRNLSVGSLELFDIDEENSVILLAAKNTLCHISFDLTKTINIYNTTPTDSEIHHCMTDSNILQSSSACQNFHYIMIFPTGNQALNINGDSVFMSETVLICSTGAYQPKCTYRNKTDMSILKSENGMHFCPFGPASATSSQPGAIKAIVTNEGRLVSGTSQDIFAQDYRLVVSDAPFNGEASIRTFESNNAFNNKFVKFLDIYDIGNFYYFFTWEKAVELQDKLYSRVGRICKNDNGVLDSNNGKVFISFLKARMSCTSEGSLGPTFFYDNLKDTEYSDSGIVNEDVKGRHLYAAFSAPLNGPAGSVVCVYTFGDGASEIGGVFDQPYLEQTGIFEWMQVENTNPVMCNTSRSLSDAKDHFLMEPTVLQTGVPIVNIDGLLFERILVDKIEGTNGKVYEVLLIGANEESFLKFLKITYIYTRNSGDQTHISQETKLVSNSSNDESIINMKLLKTNEEATIYLGTNEGLYRVPITDCHKYTDCRSCIESQDPYCAFDVSTHTCVTTLSGYTDQYLQDIDNGNYSICPQTPLSVTSTIKTTLSPTSSNAALNILSSSHALFVSVTDQTSPTTIAVCSPSLVKITTTETRTTTVIVTQGDSQRTTTTSMSKRPTTPATQSKTTSGSRLTTTSSRSNSRVTQVQPTVQPTAEGLTRKESSNHIYMMIGIGVACFLVGIAFGIVIFACLRNKDKFIWGKILSRNRRLNFASDDEKNDYEMYTGNTKMDDYEKNNARDFKKDSTPRPSTPPLSKLNPTSVPGRVTDSPVLSKYSKTGSHGKTHNRSMSSGGHMPFPLFETPNTGNHTTVPPDSPVRNNIRNTFNVEESLNNSQRQKYGKNIVCKQISREYPMTVSDSYTPQHYHSKTNSLDLDGWIAPR